MSYEPFCILACPGGFTAIEGHIYGKGLTGYYNASAQRCSEDCNNYLNVTIKDEMRDCHGFCHGCHGFVHSESGQSCKLVSQRQPNANKTIKDFQFCSKFGK